MFWCLFIYLLLNLLLYCAFQIPRTSKKGHCFNNPKSTENISWFRKGVLFWIWLLVEGTQDHLRKHFILQFLLLMDKVDRNFMQFSVSRSCIGPKYFSFIYNLRHFGTSGLLLHCCFLVVHYFLNDNVEKPFLFDLHSHQSSNMIKSCLNKQV